MNTPQGKCIFLWQPRSVEGGSVVDTVCAALDMGLRMVNLKVGSGVYKYPFQGYDLRPLVLAFNSAGILVYGWHYVYGSNSPKAEANIAEQQVSYLELDGYEIDAESHYKNYPDSQAEELMGRMKAITTRADIPLGLTTYRYPNYHRELPWQGFLKYADYWVPQVYWQPPPSDPIIELNRSVEQWVAMAGKYGYPVKPFVPAGRVYIGDGYPTPGPTANEITRFLSACKSSHPAATFWSFDNLYTHAGGAARMQAIQDFKWDTVSPPLTDKEKLDKLWAAHPELH